MKSNRYIYHYSACYQMVGGSVAKIDGVAKLVKRIASQDDYMELKPMISPDHHEKLTIDSLSYLGREKYT